MTSAGGWSPRQPDLGRARPRSARRCSAVCSTRRATTSRGTSSASRCSSRAGSTCRHAPAEGGVLAGAFPGRMPPPALEPHGSAPLSSGRSAPGWRGEPEPAGFTSEGRAGDAMRPPGSGGCDGAGGGAVPPPGARCARRGRRPGDRVARRDPPAHRRALGPARSGRVRGRARSPCGRSRRGRGALRGSHDLSAALPGRRGGRAGGAARRRAPRRRDGCRRRAPALRDAVRRLSRRGGGDDRKSIALRLEFQAADRTLTETDVAPMREAIREAITALGGGLRE